jgi:hypothetical protein
MDRAMTLKSSLKNTMAAIGLSLLTATAAAQIILQPPTKPAAAQPAPPAQDTDRHCRPGGPDYCPPRHRHYRRPIIIQQTTPAPVVTAPLSDDWEGCRQGKLNQLSALDAGNPQRANQLDEWLWKNCRDYSQELRDIEQDNM